MASADYDELAKFLREMAGRFGDAAFTDRRRLISLLADHMPDARRDIRVVGSAVDERVFEALARARPEQLSMEIERLGAKMEDNLGIRSDVAIPVVRACAYGLSLGPLPSSFAGGSTASTQSWVGETKTKQEESWIGLSEPVRQAPPVQTFISPQLPVPAPAAAQPWIKWALWGGGGIVFVLFALGMLGAYVGPVQPQSQPVAPPGLPPDQRPTVPPAPVQPPYVPQPPVQQPVQQTPPTYYGNEDFDFHIAPQSILKSAVGNPTPLIIPGATTVTTSQIMAEMKNNRRMVLIDSLADQHPMTIKGAVYLPDSGKFGNFNDQFQNEVANALNRLVQGHREVPLVFFCQGIRCWESYNAALRARAAGFANVFWFRGGLAAWENAGLPMQPTQ
jgi:PQQ-dependent catabolism-associated CXXCW motif protein